MHVNLQWFRTEISFRAFSDISHGMISPFTTAANFTVLLRAVTPMFPGKNEIAQQPNREIAIGKRLFMLFGQCILNKRR
jgi:hypothetical protein